MFQSHFQLILSPKITTIKNKKNTKKIAARNSIHITMSEFAILSLLFHYQKYLSTRWNNSETFLNICRNFCAKKNPVSTCRGSHGVLQKVTSEAGRNWQMRDLEDEQTLRQWASFGVSLRLSVSISLYVCFCSERNRFLTLTGPYSVTLPPSLYLSLSLCVLVCGLDLGSTATLRLHSHWTDRKSNTANAKRIL